MKVTSLTVLPEMSDFKAVNFVLYSVYPLINSENPVAIFWASLFIVSPLVAESIVSLPKITILSFLWFGVVPTTNSPKSVIVCPVYFSFCAIYWLYNSLYVNVDVFFVPDPFIG